MRERDHCGDPDVDGRIILRWIFSKWDVGVWTGLGWRDVSSVRMEQIGSHWTNIYEILFLSIFG
jgi:hypothetical protein